MEKLARRGPGRLGLMCNSKRPRGDPEALYEFFPSSSAFSPAILRPGGVAAIGQPWSWMRRCRWSGTRKIAHDRRIAIYRRPELLAHFRRRSLVAGGRRRPPRRLARIEALNPIYNAFSCFVAPEDKLWTIALAA